MIQTNLPLSYLNQNLTSNEINNALDYYSLVILKVETPNYVKVTLPPHETQWSFELSITFKQPNLFLIEGVETFSAATYLAFYCIFETFGVDYFWKQRNLEAEKYDLLKHYNIDDSKLDLCSFDFNPETGMLRINTFPDDFPKPENSKHLWNEMIKNSFPALIWRFSAHTPKVETFWMKTAINLKKDGNTSIVLSKKPFKLNEKHGLSTNLLEAVAKLSRKQIFTSLTELALYELYQYSESNLTLSKQKIEIWQNSFYHIIHQAWDTLLTYPIQQICMGNTYKTVYSNAWPRPDLAFPSLEIKAYNNYLTIKLLIKAGSRQYQSQDFELIDGVIVRVNQILYRIAPEFKPKLFQLFEEQNEVCVPIKNGLANTLQTWLQEINTVLPTEYINLPTIENVKCEPQCFISLKELTGNYLVFKPSFDYNGFVLAYDKEPKTLISTTYRLAYIQRNTFKEKEFFEKVRSFHPNFKNQINNNYFYISFDQVLKRNWLYKTLEFLKETGIEVDGYDKLSFFKLNSHTPTIKFEGNYQNDWFEIKINARWGNQEASLKALKKAIAQGNESVLLADGTLGMIPAEWIDKFKLIFGLATEHEKQLRLHKAHVAMLDEDSLDLLLGNLAQEAKTRKARILQLDKNWKPAPVPKGIIAKLRPYQLLGYEWLQNLNRLGLGGCLADDMGLGKTLQTITYIRYVLDLNPNKLCLVICPTSLLFNWQAEFKKFSPNTRIYLHYGTNRKFNNKLFENEEVILTTYGTMRSDLAFLSNIKWQLIVLDESQYIKNPNALATKAVNLLSADNRLVLSGTPLQNNTYDLFAQLNFAIPGLLGTQEFFRVNFSNPIDKTNDAKSATLLKQIINPFILRRTKQQVATDLPDKIEIVRWCEMLPDQQKAYDYYKDFYKNRILGLIQEKGLEKSGMYVLEGLLRLRQICDHPAMVKDQERAHYGSIKINTLLDEITNLPDGQKALIFSQFTEMLGIIKSNFDSNNIQYSYLDGSTPSEARQKAVEDFQTNPNIQVFLLSLKAGGVGLNLTAAEYVFIVDPWWNPAAEQQAIDRTHRIGQTKKVIAYKLVCKGTVEEKILALQARKANLAERLITEDAGFAKTLSKEDIEFLFS